jgi:hypothetical protein
VSAGNPRVFVLVLTLVFLAGAGALLAGVFYPPVAAVWRARAWPSLHCVIEEAGIDEHRDSQGTSRYSARVRYRYTLGGTQHLGTRISFLTASHRERSRAQAEVEHLQPGRTVPCFADPSAPDEAVLDRKLGRLAGWAAGPLIWIVVTLVAIRALMRRAPRRAESGGARQKMP